MFFTNRFWLKRSAWLFEKLFHKFLSLFLCQIHGCYRKICFIHKKGKLIIIGKRSVNVCLKHFSDWPEMFLYCYVLYDATNRNLWWCQTCPKECAEHYSQGRKICRLFHILAQFPFTTVAREPDYYHQKLNIQISERHKT